MTLNMEEILKSIPDKKPKKAKAVKEKVEKPIPVKSPERLRTEELASPGDHTELWDSILEEMDAAPNMPKIKQYALAPVVGITAEMIDTEVENARANNEALNAIDNSLAEQDFNLGIRMTLELMEHISVELNAQASKVTSANTTIAANTNRILLDTADTLRDDFKALLSDSLLETRDYILGAVQGQLGLFPVQIAGLLSSLSNQTRLIEELTKKVEDLEYELRDGGPDVVQNQFPRPSVSEDQAEIEADSKKFDESLDPVKVAQTPDFDPRRVDPALQYESEIDITQQRAILSVVDKLKAPMAVAYFCKIIISKYKQLRGETPSYSAADVEDLLRFSNAVEDLPEIGEVVSPVYYAANKR